MGTLDKDYSKVVKRMLDRLQIEQRRTWEEQQLWCYWKYESITADSTHEEDYEPNIKKIQIPELVPAIIPKESSVNAASSHTSTATHLSIVGNILAASGLNLNNFTLSSSSASSSHHTFFKKGSSLAIEEIRSSEYVLVHIDGKQMLDYTRGRINFREREAIVLSFPDLAKPQVLILAAIASSKQ